MPKSTSWEKIFKDYNILENNFDESPFVITAEQIKESVKHFRKTAEKEVRILCMQTKREDVPDIIRENNLFILPIRNGKYVIVRGEGYVDIPDIEGDPIPYKPNLDFNLTTSGVGDSEMQHIDYAFAISMLRTFLEDDSLQITIRGRKYTPEFSFFVGNNKIDVSSVQTEVDAGYEGRDQIILVECKNSQTKNTIIRQLFYPFKQWSSEKNNPENKAVRNVFFEKRGKEYLLWEYQFTDKNNYNSIDLLQKKKYVVVQNL